MQCLTHLFSKTLIEKQTHLLRLLIPLYSDSQRRCRVSLAVRLPDVKRETGEPLPCGEVGELVLRGPNIMQGYWKREEETKVALRDGWLHTGDLGKMDEDGYFYIVERAKDVIIASGFKVFPREVEEVLFQHPVVLDAAVVGVPDAYRGETVAAFIVLKPGVTASEHIRLELIQFCEQELTSYKVPRVLEFRQRLPKSLIGKVIRRELRVGQTEEPARYFDAPDTQFIHRERSE